MRDESKKDRRAEMPFEAREGEPGNGRPGGRRVYRYRPRSERKQQIMQGVMLVGLAAGILFGLGQLITAGVNMAESRKTSSRLQSVYDVQTTMPPQEPTATAPETEQTSAMGAEPERTGVISQATASPDETEEKEIEASISAVTAEPLERLGRVAYPDNPEDLVRSRFVKLQTENQDIIGWLTIDNMVSEAVVQRDNVFYLDHDAKGRKNTNGALFMDAAITLKSRPYSLVIYGHNMRTGTMFGNLRRYDDISYYHGNPLISFDSMYEDGQYIIFASSRISMKEGDENYLNFFAFTSSSVSERQEMIDTLISSSAFTCEVDVSPQDQVLALVTCVGNDDERRIVSARRVRDGESESQLKQVVLRSMSK